jgi:hypothetical protein
MLGAACAASVPAAADEAPDVFHKSLLEGQASGQ